MKIYIAGSITGNPDYKKQFQQVEDLLKSKGHVVINPSKLPGGLTQGEYMSICLPMLQVCDVLYLLRGWEESEGAQIEYNLAKKSGKIILDESILDDFEIHSKQMHNIVDNLIHSYKESNSVEIDEIMAEAVEYMKNNVLLRNVIV